jgi:GT2 family glycosyltransferase
MKVTAILLNYRRPDNTVSLVKALRGQTVRPETLLVNNSSTVRRFNADLAVYIPWNAGCLVRHLFALYVDSEWIMVIDDDLIPHDARFVEDALTVATQRPNAITGAFGRRLGKRPLYYHGQPDVVGDTALVKGRFMLYRRDLLARVNFGRLIEMGDPEYLRRCDDLFLSLEIGRGQPVHWADAGLQARLVELPAGEVGLEKDGQHFEIRERFCADYMALWYDYGR